MSLLSEKLNTVENIGACKLHKMASDEPATSEVVCWSDAPTGGVVAQSFISDHTHDSTSIIHANVNNPDDQPLSESDEDSFQDIWDDFELSKPMQKSFKQSDKVKRKDSRQQMRLKSMVRYKSSTMAAFDEQTKFLLQRLMVARYMNHYFDIAGAGSHSIVINGKSSSLYSMPTRVVVKVYENSENSKAIYRRVQNEYQVLGKIYRCHIHGPQPACAWRNIIVMAVIGEGGTAPSITKALSVHHYNNYFEITDQIKKMYQTAKVVHGNLSHRNILWFESQPYFIGWSHAVPAHHPKALHLLIKDCYSVTSIYQDKLKVGLKTTEELFKFVTELPEIETELLKVLDNIKMNTKSNLNSVSKNKSSVNYAQILEYCAKLHR